MLSTMTIMFLLAFAAAGEDYKEAPFQGWAQHEQRGSTRLIYFSKTSDKPWNFSPGQVAIEFGQPVWKAEYAQRFDELTLGKRWRMGQNYWSNLDTRFPLMMGSARLQPGIYYVLLERPSQEKFNLVLLDPDKASDLKIDAWHVNRKESPAGLRVPLEWKRTEEVASKLELQFDLDETDHRKALLNIRFGPHHLRVPVRVEFEGKQVEGE